MVKGTIIITIAFGGITIVLEDGVERLEFLVGLISCHFKYYYHEGSHKESTVDHFVTWLSRDAVMEYSVFLIIFVS